MLFKHPILFGEADALEKVQKLNLKVLKGFRHAPYEAPVQHLRLFSLTHRRIRGHLMSMYKITHSLLLFPMKSTFTHPTRKGLRGHDYKFHQQRCRTRRRQFDFTVRVVLFWNKRPAKIVNEFSVKSFRALLDSHWQSLFSEVSNPPPPPPTNHCFSTHRPTYKTSHPNDPSFKPYHTTCPLGITHLV